MNRKSLIALTIIASTVSGFACGGDDEKPAKDPSTMSSTSTSAAAVDTTPPVDSASAMPSASTPPPAPKSLYDRLGGKDAIGKVVEDFLAIVKDDKRINKRFAADFKDAKKGQALRDNVVTQISEATGGDAKYTGKDMKTAHKGMKITEDDWNAFVEDFKKALDKNNVGKTEQDELIGKIAPMHDDIVEVKPKGK